MIIYVFYTQYIYINFYIILGLLVKLNLKYRIGSFKFLNINYNTP